MSNDSKFDRHLLSFAQAEGAEPLPTQLQQGELSQKLRSRLWFILYRSLCDSGHTEFDPFGPLVFPWNNILYDYHVLRLNRFVDEFQNLSHWWISTLKQLLQHHGYINIFEFLQFVLRHRSCPNRFVEQIEWALAEGHAAYRVIEGKTIFPITSEAEVANLDRAFKNLTSTEFGGARQHLLSAASSITVGAYADSVRESIHSVESVARTLAPSGLLSEALTKLEKSQVIHPALKQGFKSIYGYTSDERGIRHALLDDAQANVDEADALFMLGACAAFVSYLIQKTIAAGPQKA